MGKASRRRSSTTTKVPPAPFVRRPFEGVPGEPDWVAMREIVPAATATIRVDPAKVRAVLGDDAPEGLGDSPLDVTVATVLPTAWPGMRRNDGTLMLGLQTLSGTRDPSRDYAKALLELLRTGASESGAAGESATDTTGNAAEAGASTQQPAPTPELATAATPRLQDLLDLDAPFEVTVHDGFGFWTAGAELDAEAAASLRQAEETILPTTKMAAVPAAYWVRVGERTHIRWLLSDDEDAAVDALARLHAAGTDTLGEGTRLLGCFRACGLLVPVWDLDPTLDAAAYEDALAAVAAAYTEALADTSALTPDQRRAKNGLLSRQLTLR